MTASTAEGSAKSAELADDAAGVDVPLGLALRRGSLRGDHDARSGSSSRCAGCAAGDCAASRCRAAQRKGRGAGRGLVGLTFDDGYQDFVTHAMPILQRYGFTATAFVLAGRLGGQNEWSRPGPNKPLLTRRPSVRDRRRPESRSGRTGWITCRCPRSTTRSSSAETVRSRAILQELLGQQVGDSAIRTDTWMLVSWRRCGPPATTTPARSGRRPTSAATPFRGPTCMIGTATWRLDAKRIRSPVLTVGNRIAVRRHRGD